LKSLRLTLGEEGRGRAAEEDLFTHFYATDTLEQLNLIITVTSSTDKSHPWPAWISQLKNQISLCNLCVSLRESYNDFDDDHDEDGLDLSNPFTVPEYLKSLPPRLESLVLPCPMLPAESDAALPIVNSHGFLDCFRHFPLTLMDLSFEDSPMERSIVPLWLTDDCFAHLPPSLTQLSFSSAGLTERFWDVIPPNIRQFNVTRRGSHEFLASFSSRQREYLSKFTIK
jgi:hypothetical protein